jgi:hypothetical protein
MLDNAEWGTAEGVDEWVEGVKFSFTDHRFEPTEDHYFIPEDDLVAVRDAINYFLSE